MLFVCKPFRFLVTLWITDFQHGLGNVSHSICVLLQHRDSHPRLLFHPRYLVSWTRTFLCKFWIVSMGDLVGFYGQVFPWTKMSTARLRYASIMPRDFSLKRYTWIAHGKPTATDGQKIPHDSILWGCINRMNLTGTLEFFWEMDKNTEKALSHVMFISEVRKVPMMLHHHEVT